MKKGNLVIYTTQRQLLERTQEGVFSKLVFSKLSPVVQMSKLAYKSWCPFHFSWVFAMSMSQRQRNILLLVPIMFLMQMKFFGLNGAPKIIQRQTQGVILALSFSCSTLNHMNTVFIICGHRTTSYPSIVNAVVKEHCQSGYGKSLPAGLSASILDDHSSFFTVW